MNFGKMNRKIQIKNKVFVRDDFGAEIVTYQLFAKVWAEVLPVTGREYFSVSQFIPEATLKFRIRFKKGFCETSKIHYCGTDYDILYIAEMGFKDGIEIVAKKP